MIWTAVGAIATAVAVIVALIANYRTNRNNEKNRKLQITLLRQQRERKKLDELVQNVMQLSESMNPLAMIDYSSKFANNGFKVEDMRFLEHIAMNSSGRAVNLTLQMEGLNHPVSAQAMLDCFWTMWQDYNLWSLSVRTLFDCESSYMDGSYGQGEKALQERVINNMVKRILEMDSNLQMTIDDLLKERNLRARAKVLCGWCGAKMAKEIQRQKTMLHEKVIAFIRIEQKRIDDMVE